MAPRGLLQPALNHLLEVGFRALGQRGGTGEADEDAAFLAFDNRAEQREAGLGRGRLSRHPALVGALGGDVGDLRFATVRELEALGRVRDNEEHLPWKVVAPPDALDIVDGEVVRKDRVGGPSVSLGAIAARRLPATASMRSLPDFSKDASAA